MNLPDKDDPIRIYLTDNPSSATQLVWKEELLPPKLSKIPQMKTNKVIRR